MIHKTYKVHKEAKLDDTLFGEILIHSKYVFLCTKCYIIKILRQKNIKQLVCLTVLNDVK